MLKPRVSRARKDLTTTMRYFSSLTVGLVLALGLLATTDTAHAHGGFYARGGVGLGYYSMSVDVPVGEQSFSGMTIPIEVLLGGSIIPGLVIGGGLSLDYAPSPSYSSNGADSDTDFSQYLIGIGPFVDFYPNVDSGLHVQGRVGWGGVETSTANGAGASDPTGLMMTIGGGYDHWMSDTLGVGVLGRLTYAPLSLNDLSFPTIAFNVLASFTYY